MLDKDTVIAYLKSTGIFGNISYTKSIVDECRNLSTKSRNSKGMWYTLCVCTYLETGATGVGLSAGDNMEVHLICSNIMDMDFLRNTIEYIKHQLLL